jgi:hypothetical protein
MRIICLSEYVSNIINNLIWVLKYYKDSPILIANQTPSNLLRFNY